MKRILITGAAGFIGSHLAESLMKKGFKVFGIDNFSGAYDKKYYSNNLNILNSYKFFILHKVNLLNQRATNSILKKNNFDFIIHCAAKTNVRESTKNPQEYIRNNVLGTQILLEAIKQYSPQSKIIIFSSSSVYGKQNKVPFSENMIPNPISPYGLSKYLMEQIVKYYSDNYNLKIVVLRPFSIYGPRGRQDMLPSILLNCIKNNLPFTQYGNDKNNKRDWTHIDDLVYILTKIINKYNFKTFEIFNIGRSKPVGIESFIEIFNELSKSKIKIIKKTFINIEMPIVYSDISKAKKILDFKPENQINEFIRKISKTI